MPTRLQPHSFGFLHALLALTLVTVVLTLATSCSDDTTQENGATEDTSIASDVWSNDVAPIPDSAARDVGVDSAVDSSADDDSAAEDALSTEELPGEDAALDHDADSPDLPLDDAPDVADDGAVIEDAGDVIDEPCPDNVTCIDSFPATIVDTTVGAERNWSEYPCAVGTDESGPERLYRIELPYAGFFAVELTDEENGSDIDVHILLERDIGTCVDRGHYTAGAYLDAGIYWVVADTWVDSEGIEFSGQFELSMNLTSANDLAAHGMNNDMASDALTIFSAAWRAGESKRFEYTISDFSIHSSQRRQWIVNLATGELLYHLHVGHGEASIVGDDLGFSSVFSNIPQSHQSSLGLVRTAETYYGDYDYSLRIDGLEPEFNDNVRDRFIVVHPWYGSDPDVIATEGWAVPSWGCATIDPHVSAEVIDTIKEGALMVFWYPDAQWRQGSTFLD